MLGLKDLIIKIAVLCVLASGNSQVWADTPTSLRFKNINQDHAIFYTIGYQIRPKINPIKKWLFGEKKELFDIYIFPDYQKIEPQKTGEINKPPAKLNEICSISKLDACAPLAALNEETKLALKARLDDGSLELDELMPVLIFSWNEEFFDNEGEIKFVRNQQYIDAVGGMVIDFDDKEIKTYLDVAEWKNIGTNFTAGYEVAIQRWRDNNEPAYVQVVAYAQEYETKEITIKSYASYPIYYVLMSCEIDLTGLQQARRCSFALDKNGAKIPPIKVGKNETKTQGLKYDVRVTQYQNAKPKAFLASKEESPYRVYMVSSPFVEDIAQRASHTISTFRNILTNSRYHRIASVDIFDGGYNNFYLYEKIKGISFFVGDYIATDLSGKLTNFLANMVTPLGGAALPTGGPYVNNLISYLKDSVLNEEAKVIDRSAKDKALSDGEKESTKARRLRIYNFLKNMPLKDREAYVPKEINIKDIKPEMLPVVGFAPSGGGYRAAIATLGLKNAFSKTKVDPFFNYQVGLSGSTWYLSKLLHEAQAELNRRTVTENQLLLNDNFYRRFYQDFRQRPQHNSAVTNFLAFPNFDKEHDLLMGFFEPMLVKWAYLQEISLVDLMGAGLWYNLFRENLPFDLKLSNYQDLLKSGNVPFTMMTSVAKNSRMSRDDYLWFEFSPFEVGATVYKRFIPTKYFSRYFINGSSVDVGPEPNLPYLMGMWGSAMSASVLDGIRQEVVPKGIRLSAELPFLSDIIAFAEKDWPALQALAVLLMKNELDKGDLREALRYTIKYLDKLMFSEFHAPKPELERLKLKLIDTEKRLDELKIYDKEVELDQLSWLFKDVKPYAAAAYNAQPDRVSILSKRLATATKLSDLQAFSGAIVGNPYYGLDFPKNLVKSDPTIELRDGGVDFNIPFPPLLAEAREMDIIVAFDASPDTGDLVKALQNGCQYALRHGLKRFPIDECLAYFSDAELHKRLVEDPITVIGNPDSVDTITIIYVPLKTLTEQGYAKIADAMVADNKKFINYNPHNDVTSTMNLRYTPTQVDQLAQFSEVLGQAATKAISDAYRRKLQKRVLGPKD